jgi:hypothetical protein
MAASLGRGLYGPDGKDCWAHPINKTYTHGANRNYMRALNYKKPSNEHHTGAILAPNPVQAVSPRGRFFADQTFHFETLRNAGSGGGSLVKERSLAGARQGPALIWIQTVSSSIFLGLRADYYQYLNLWYFKRFQAQWIQALAIVEGSCQ